MGSTVAALAGAAQVNHLTIRAITGDLRVKKMSSPLSRVITNEIFRVPARRQRKAVVKPSDIPTLKGYTARLVDQKWLRLAARRSHA